MTKKKIEDEASRVESDIDIRIESLKCCLDDARDLLIRDVQEKKKQLLE